MLWELPVVKTGSGGYHIYCKLPENYDYKLLRKALKDIPGVDFKKKGGYVVAESSRHPDGEFYTWENIDSIPVVPKQLLEKLKREVRNDFEYQSGYGVLNGTQLQELILDKLDVENYGNNDSWEPILMASHYATAGQGVEEFIEWCIGDANYSGDENSINRES